MTTLRLPHPGDHPVLLRTTCYIITNAQSRFLVRLEDGEPTWSVAAHDALAAHFAWIDLAVARAKCLQCQRVLGEDLSLSLLSFVKIDESWHLETQRGMVG
jgi:hypothetical protein